MIKLSKEILNIINELAFNRKKAIFEIAHLCIPYTEHIIKLAIYGNNEKYLYDVPKWKDEIYNFIRQAALYYDLKGNTKLKPRDYMDNFFFGLMETEKELKKNFIQILNDFLRKGYEIPENINYTLIYNNHCKFVNDILKFFPDIEYKQVIELLNKYIIG